MKDSNNLDDTRIKTLYFDGRDIYLLTTEDKLFLIARWDKLSRKKKREIVNDCVVPDEFDDFNGTLEEAIDWLQQHREEMIENFDKWMQEYTGFDTDLYNGRIMGKFVGSGAIVNWAPFYTGFIKWDKPMKVKNSLGNVKFIEIKTVIDYYKEEN